MSRRFSKLTRVLKKALKLIITEGDIYLMSLFHLDGKVRMTCELEVRKIISLVTLKEIRR